MALLFDSIDFPALCRMTGVWTNTIHDRDSGDDIAHAQLIAFPPEQDPTVESDFLCSHLPFVVGGFHGVFADGQGWMVALQKAPASIASPQSIGGTPRQPFAAAIDRALTLNPEAQARDEVTWARGDVEAHYRRAGVDSRAVEDWSLAELLWGLLAECCNVPLIDVVDRRSDGCAFPERVHDCHGEVFSDVFALWTTGALNRPEPELET